MNSGAGFAPESDLRGRQARFTRGFPALLESILAELKIFRDPINGLSYVKQPSGAKESCGPELSTTARRYPDEALVEREPYYLRDLCRILGFDAKSRTKCAVSHSLATYEFQNSVLIARTRSSPVIEANRRGAYNTTRVALSSSRKSGGGS